MGRPRYEANLALKIFYGILSFTVCVIYRIALDQASKRGWFTYTDLAAIWEATDIQSSMMLATRQTAKVILGLLCI